MEEEYYEEKEKGKSDSFIGIAALIIGVIALGGLIVLFFIYFFRRPSPVLFNVWFFQNISPDGGTGSIATITPQPQYIYVLSTSISSVVLNLPTSNVSGTQFKMVVSQSGQQVNVTAPSGVTLRLVNKIAAGQEATFTWNNNMSYIFATVI